MPSEQSTAIRMASTCDQNIGWGLRIIRNSSRTPRRFQNAGSRCFDGQSRCRFCFRSITTITFLHRLASITGIMCINRYIDYRRGWLLQSSRFQRSIVVGAKRYDVAAELHFIRARLQGGKINKAKKGELRSPLPVGFCYDEEPYYSLIPMNKYAI